MQLKTKFFNLCLFFILKHLTANVTSANKVQIPMAEFENEINSTKLCWNTVGIHLAQLLIPSSRNSVVLDSSVLRVYQQGPIMDQEGLRKILHLSDWNIQLDLWEWSKRPSSRNNWYCVRRTRTLSLVKFPPKFALN